MSFNITCASNADIPALAELLSLLFTLEQDMRPDLEKQKRGLGLLLQETQRARVLVARDDSRRAVGMVSGQLVVSTAEGGLSVWVEDLIIAADFRGLGIGRALLDNLLQWAKAQGASRAQLLADNDNQPAWDFYERLGWQNMHMGAKRLFL